MNNNTGMYGIDSVIYKEESSEVSGEDLPNNKGKSKKNNIHQGHRQRVKKAFLENGIDSFSSFQLLETLLFYSVARKDTNVVAHNLIEAFGNFTEVMHAPYEKLRKVKDVGDSSAFLIYFIRVMAELYGDRNYDIEFHDNNMRNYRSCEEYDDEKEYRLKTKQKAVLEGIQNYSEVQILEILMFYCFPERIDTFKISYMLIEKFGALVNVLNADFYDLIKIDGMTENAASLICYAQLISRKYLTMMFEQNYLKSFRDHTIVCRYSETVFLGASTEFLYLILFDRKMNFSGLKLIGQGSTEAVGASIKDILKCALRNNSDDIIVIHNHPDGFGRPSTADLALTKRIFNACKDFGINLHDHIVVGRDGAFSIRAGLYCLDLWGGL